MKGFDKHFKELLEEHPVVALEHAKFFAELPLATQLAIMRRRRKLSQRALAKKLKIPQPHIARTENIDHDPRISSLLKAAKAVRCHLMLVPDEALGRIAAV
ncbi:MAG TPA: helix-turn-helix transcriptional regulator [Candidatus Omnitrophota bacterium]|nr:helix-turn-helix transcriptional regulator [Candidatus Omnitrophota bacterium]